MVPSENQDLLEKNVKGLIDQELKKLNFEDICRSISHTVIDKFHQIEVEHDEIKKLYNDIGERVDILIANENHESSSTDMQPHNVKNEIKINGVADIIIIDDSGENTKNKQQDNTETKTDVKVSSESKLDCAENVLEIKDTAKRTTCSSIGSNINSKLATSHDTALSSPSVDVVVKPETPLCSKSSSVTTTSSTNLSTAKRLEDVISKLTASKGVSNVSSHQTHSVLEAIDVLCPNSTTTSDNSLTITSTTTTAATTTTALVVDSSSSLELPTTVPKIPVRPTSTSEVPTTDSNTISNNALSQNDTLQTDKNIGKSAPMDTVLPRCMDNSGEKNELDVNEEVENSSVDSEPLKVNKLNPVLKELCDNNAATSDTRQSSTDTRQSSTDTKQSSIDTKQSSTDTKQSSTDTKQSSTDTRHSSTDTRQSSTDTKQSSTDTRHSSTDTKQSITDTRQSSTDTRQSSTDTKQSSTDTKQSSTDTRHSSTDTKQSSTDTKQSSTDTRHLSTDTRQSSTDTRQSSTDTKQSSTDTKQSSTDTKQSSTDTKQSITDTRQSSTDTRQSITDTKQSSTDTKQSITDTRQSSTDTRQSITDTKQSSTDTKQSITDTKQSSTDTKQSITDTRQSSTDTRQSSTDTKQSSTESLKIVESKCNTQNKLDSNNLSKDLKTEVCENENIDIEHIEAYDEDLLSDKKANGETAVSIASEVYKNSCIDDKNIQTSNETPEINVKHNNNTKTIFPPQAICLRNEPPSLIKNLLEVNTICNTSPKENPPELTSLNVNPVDSIFFDANKTISFDKISYKLRTDWDTSNSTISHDSQVDNVGVVKSGFDGIDSSQLLLTETKSEVKTTNTKNTTKICIQKVNSGHRIKAPKQPLFPMKDLKVFSLSPKVSNFCFEYGRVVFAKPGKSDIWYKAKLIKETKTKKGGKYLIRFLSGQKLQQSVDLKCIAGNDHIHVDDVEIGTRIVAGRPSDTVNSTIQKKYKDISTATSFTVMFAGTIAELACPANRYRYLVFFDDGYAQYLPLNRMFPVIHSSKEIWEDVSSVSGEFIKEYLQEYPFRPLVVTKMGCSMQTEWNGEWWDSRVVSIDSSLVKILFDVDQRSEWIYRGTTRLEPMFNHYIPPQPKKKKKGATAKAVEVEESYVDEKITDPQFGICKYSVKDPSGSEQIMEWGQAFQNVDLIYQRCLEDGGNTVSMSSPPPVHVVSPARKDSPKITQKKRKLKRSSSIVSSTSESSKTSTIDSGSLKKKKLKVDTEEKPSQNLNISRANHTESITSPEEMSQQYVLGALSALVGTDSPTPQISSPLAHNDVIDRPKQVAPLKLHLSATNTGQYSPVTNSRLNSPSIPSTPPTPSLPQTPPRVAKLVKHACDEYCISDRRELLEHHRQGNINYFSIPFMLGWKRESAKKLSSYHRDIYYRTPCKRRMRNLADITRYLLQTKCTNVCIDMFCFYAKVSCRNTTLNKTRQPKILIDDLSDGRETCPVVCINEINDEQPPQVAYISSRNKAEDVYINIDPGFLVCCDCTDNCQDKSKCQCAQLTVQSSNAIDGVIDSNAGYQYRRLKESITTGIYECNPNCSCRKETCYNRVVQNGIQLRLQVFMTENRGWGVRCADDIPNGTFICTYAGQVLNEQTANREGMDYGDEYLAEMDHIEVVEKAKDGYESDVPELREKQIEDSDSESYSESESSESIINISSDSSSDDEVLILMEPTAKKHKRESACGLNNVHDATDTVLNDQSDGIINPRESPTTLLSVVNMESSKTLAPCHVPLKRLLSGDLPHRMDSMSDDSLLTDITAPDICLGVEFFENASTTFQLSPSAEEKKQHSPSHSPSDENENNRTDGADDSPQEKVDSFKSALSKTLESNDKGDHSKRKVPETVAMKTGEIVDCLEKVPEVVTKKSGDVVDCKQKLPESAAPKSGETVGYKQKTKEVAAKKSGENVDCQQKVLEAVGKMSVQNVAKKSESGIQLAKKSTCQLACKSTASGIVVSRTNNKFKALNADVTSEKKAVSTRSLYCGDNQMYIIDAKSFGNVGRFMNHSCAPNLFVQNVMVDTHDLRFPWVAFFAQQNIPAHTELTWDYSYEIGSVPGKELICKCGAKNCKGRLL